jgi:PST family polysaccharide transporter
VQGFVDVPGAQIQRTFRQNVLFRANVVAFVLSNTTLLALATVINGAEAFAWSRVVGNLVVGVIIVLVLEKRYLPGWNARFVGPLLRFGVPVALGTLLSRFVLNVDFIIVGREMSTTDLGFYMLAFTICSWPTAALGAVMDQVALPAFSGARRDGRDLRVTVYRAVRLVAFVACPIGAFTVAFAHPLIETVYGAKWLTAAPVLQVLALYGVLYVLGTLFDEMMIASDKTVTMFVVQATALVALVPTLIIGIRLGGLVGVGIGHIVVMLGVTMPAYLVAMNATTGAGLVVVVRALLRPVLAAGAAAGVALLVTSFVDHPLAKLALGGLTGLMAYVAVAGPQLLELFPDAIAHKRGVVTATQWLSVAANRLRLSRTR